MNRFGARLLQFWYQLNDRERYLLLWGGVCLGLYLAYVIYSSLAQAVVVNTQQLSEKKETLAWIKHVEAQRSPQQSGLITLDKSKGLTVLSQQLKTKAFHGFSYQLQQLNEDELQVSFEKVPYKICFVWLASMSKKYNITIKELHVDRTNTPGLVKLMVIITLHA